MSRPPEFWRGLAERDAPEPVWDALAAEFPALAAAIGTASRRDVLRVMAASLALAVTGCGREAADDAIPYVDQPEDQVPGIPRVYASAVTLGGIAQPILATTYDGRPTKLEGNPDHPASGGATDVFTQAAVLSLYDPDRAQAPSVDGRPVSWAEVESALGAQRRSWSARRGAGLRVLIGATTSPTLIRQLGVLLGRLPEARIHVFEPVGAERRYAGTQLAFGRPLELHHRIDAAQAIVSLEDDWLGPGPRQTPSIRAWAAGRAQPERPRLWVAESTPSLTGAAATQRLPVASTRMPQLALALAAALGDGGTPGLSDAERAWVDAAAGAVRAAGSHALITAGAHLAAETQALVHRLNARLDAVGTTVWYGEPLLYQPPGPDASLDALARDLGAGAVDTLIVLDANPVYAAPRALRLGERIARARLRIHVGPYDDETAAVCQWRLPMAHVLESWSDARAADGSATIIQPLVAPFYAVRSVHEIVSLLLGPEGGVGRDIVQGTWRERLGDADDARWRQAVRDGIVPGTAATPVAVEPVAAPASAQPADSPASLTAVEVVFRPDPCVWDGRFANNAWLQELPKPLTTLTWDAAVLVSPALARERGLSNGDVVALAAHDAKLSGPAWIMPGQAERTVTLFLGYGRRRAGQVGSAIGYDAAALRLPDAPWSLQGVSLARTGDRRALAPTQLQHGMAGEDLVRVVAIDAPAPPAPPPPPSLYPEQPLNHSVAEPAWGMVIDLDRCTGCNACAIACQAENNVPVVGRDQVAAGRAMHWLRIARYYRGAPDDPEAVFQPVPCMHCEKAPCEQGCPVHATVHGPDGTNQMIYNRCIGTRTCASYCPYKVRRFNFFDFTTGEPGGRAPQRNPNVTVRTRGVMEKCTYCVQRISAARAAADIAQRPIADGEVVTACQAVCPAQAISFGNIADPASAVARARHDPHHYTLLDHLGTRPRTGYLPRRADESET